MFDFLTKRVRYGYFFHDKQQAFLEDLSALLQDGVSLYQAVETIQRVSEGMIERMATHIAHCIASGKTLAEGMQAWFPRSLVEVVRAGENNGTLLTALEAVSSLYKRQLAAIKNFFQMLIYPSVILLFAIFIVVFMRYSVLDGFAAMQPVSTWPSLGQSLYRLSFLIEHWWWLAIVVLLLLVFLVSRMLEQVIGDLRLKLDNFPLASLYRDIISAQFMETLGLLLSNGVDLKTALSIMHREAAPYLSWHILKMELRLSQGKNANLNIIDTKLISRNDLVRLNVIANCKGFEKALVRLGEEANRRVSKSMVMMGKISGGVLLFLSGAMVAMMVFGVQSISTMMASL